MKTISLKAALVAMLLLGPMAGAALAKSFKLPDKNPAATMSIPDSWKPDRDRRRHPGDLA